MGFSLRGAVDKVGDGLEHGVKVVKQKTGEAIDHGAHIVGDGLDHVGLDDAADWVEDKGDGLADHLGAHVAEQQLGQTDDPAELLHGDAGKIREAATHLARFAVAFDTGHAGLSHLDPGDWNGLGGEAFRARFTTQPPKWARAAQACCDAATALDAYAHTVDWARGQAEEAVRLWKQSQAKRKTAVDAYNAAVDTYHDQVNTYNGKVGDGKDPGAVPVKPAAFTDPGAKDRQAAKETLDAARQQRDSAADHAQTAITTATALAPAKPDFTDRMENDLGDVGKALPIAGEHFAGGLIRSGTDLLKFTRRLDPTDPYNITHPAQYLTHLNSTAAGLADMTAHPERLPATLLGTGWGSDGPEAGGRLIGNILLTLTADGGSTAAEKAAAAAAKDAGEQAGRDVASTAAVDERAAGGVRQSDVTRTLDNSLDKDTYLRDVAAQYGIKLRGAGQDIDVIFDPDLPAGQLGVTRASDGGRVIRVGPDGVFDDATAANTIAHELSHARYCLKHGDFAEEIHGSADSLADGTPYGSGNALQDWIEGNR